MKSTTFIRELLGIRLGSLCVSLVNTVPHGGQIHDYKHRVFGQIDDYKHESLVTSMTINIQSLVRLMSINIKSLVRLITINVQSWSD